MEIYYSVIIPVYFGSKRIYKVLDSLCRQSTPLKSFEVIVVDDGSTLEEFAELEKLIKTYASLNIKLLRNSLNCGPATARNIGIDNAMGEYYFFTDDDCELPAQWIETHMSLYKKYKHLSAVFGWYTTSSYVTKTNIYHLFIESYYLIIMKNFIKSLFYTPNDIGKIFSSSNTANLSVHKSVTGLVRFNEVFIKPGTEDTQFGEAIIAAGFVAISVPYFILHQKEMSFMHFIHLAKNRSHSLNVSNFFTKNDYSAFRSLRYFLRELNFVPLHITKVRKLKLQFLMALWHLYRTPIANFFYTRSWHKKMKEKSLKRFTESTQKILDNLK